METRWETVSTMLQYEYYGDETGSHLPGLNRTYLPNTRERECNFSVTTRAINIFEKYAAAQLARIHFYARA